jgi:hypothetical protein
MAIATEWKVEAPAEKEGIQKGEKRKRWLLT